jgi:hypothetical protein
MAFDTSSNKRVIYSTQAVALGDMGATSVVDSWGTGDALLDGSGKVMIMHGVQSISMEGSFSLEAIQELGQLGVYEMVEEVPDLNISMERVLDGYTMAYHAATVRAVDPTLAGRQNARADLRMIIGLDTDSAVSSGDNLAAEMYASGTYWSSYSLNMAAQGVFTESLSLVGNNRRWLGAGSSQLLLGAGDSVVGAFNVFGNDSPQSPSNSIMRRRNFITGSGLVTRGGNDFVTVVPDFITGVSNNGSATGANGASAFVNCGTVNTDNTHIQNISFSVEGSRETILQLGTMAPYYRGITFPTPVSTQIEVIAVAGDNIDFVEDVPSSGNLKNHTIQVCLDDSTIVQVGNKNKLNSVSFGGGDATGGNATITYSLTNNNDFVLLHSGDPMPLETGAYFKYWFT